MKTSSYEARVVKDDGEQLIVPASDVSRPFADYAVLCTSVYATAVTEIEGDTLADWSSGKKRLPTPDGWVRCLDIEKFINTEKNRLDLEGLVLEIWAKELALSSGIIAIVYRGTATLHDWKSNLNWFLGRRLLGVTDKYSQLRQLLAVLLPEIRRIYGSVRIVATGHSLGGALAQFSAYAHDCIKQVYAFDPSPVTGYFSIERNVRQQNAEHVEINRIYARFEGLAFLRGPIKWLRNMFKMLFPRKRTRVTITEYRFNFETRNPLRQHNMGILAWHLNH